MKMETLRCEISSLPLNTWVFTMLCRYSVINILLNHFREEKWFIILIEQIIAENRERDSLIISVQ